MGVEASSHRKNAPLSAVHVMLGLVSVGPRPSAPRMTRLPARGSIGVLALALQKKKKKG